MNTDLHKLGCLAATAALWFAGAPVLMPQMAAANAATVEVLVTGLDNPRGIAIGPAGRILIAEAGAGGTGVGGATPAMTGHLTEFSRERYAAC